MRNDLAKLSEQSWINPQPQLLVFEAKDEDISNSFETVIEATDEIQETAPVFSNIYESATDVDTIVTPDAESTSSDIYNSTETIESIPNGEIGTGAVEISQESSQDIDSAADFSGSVSDTDIVGTISNANPGPEVADKTDVAASEAAATQKEQEIYVWIPKSGKKYHNNAECSNMSGPSKVTVNEAEALGFTKCKRCY